jgi:hypothetical protein
VAVAVAPPGRLESHSPFQVRAIGSLSLLPLSFSNLHSQPRLYERSQLS